jgi:endo-1,4-beta-xylanase
MRASLNAVFALLSIVAVKAQETEPPPPAQPPVILRDLAKPRWFGTAANTSWLFNDANYTEVAKTQVCLHFKHRTLI